MKKDTTDNPSPSNFDICPTCGGELIVGSYPFCKGNPADHETVRTRMAQSIRGTVYFENAKGEVRFPPSPNSKCPNGFERKELTTLRAADKFMREQNQRERIRADENVHHENSYWSSVYKDGASKLETLLRQGRFTGQRAEYVEQKIREMRNHTGKATRDPNFYIEPLVYDSSNRDSWCGPETGWKERKD